MPAAKPTQIPLWNDLDIRFDGSKVRGKLDDTLDLRGYLSWTDEEARAPIHPSLEAAAIPEGEESGDYIAPLAGTDIGEQLEEFTWKRCYIIGESVPPGAYFEAIAVTIVPHQGA